jgi:hypothetical protein
MPALLTEDIDAAQLGRGALHHRRDRVGLGHVRRVEEHLDAMLGGEPGPQPLDLGGVAETVQDDARAVLREPRRDAQADARGRAGDERGLACQ